MVKAYLRYERASAFGVIASGASRCDVLASRGNAALVAAPAVDAVLVWNTRTGTVVHTLSNEQTCKAGHVTAIAVAPDRATIAVGHADGSIRLWRLHSGPAQQSRRENGQDQEAECFATFNGHRSGVSSLSFTRTAIDLAPALGSTGPVQRKRSDAGALVRDSSTTEVLQAPTRLASGSNDGDVILWDVVSEMGLFRVTAHNDAVTGLRLIDRGMSSFIISCSKDGTSRVYDVESQHCVQTLVGHRSEVWAMAFSGEHGLLVTGSVDAILRVYKFRAGHAGQGDLPEADGAESSTDDGMDPDGPLIELGTVERKSAAARVVDMSMETIDGQTYLMLNSADRSGELFLVRSSRDAEVHRKRRRQRRIEKARKAAKAEDGTQQTAADGLDDSDALLAKDFLVSVRPFKMSFRVRSVSLLTGDTTRTNSSSASSLRFVVQYANNALEVNSMVVKSKKKKSRKKQRHRTASAATTANGDAEHDADLNDAAATAAATLEEADDEEGEGEDEIGSIQRLSLIENEGHRGDVRSVAISGDDKNLFSVSRKSAKLWNMATGQCIRTMTTTGYGLSSCFVGAENRFAAVGSKEGTVEIFDLTSGDVVACALDGHDDAVWGLCLDGPLLESTTLVSGSADRTVRFWEFGDALFAGEEANQLEATRTLKLPDEVLSVCVAYGRDDPILVVALMDSTVRAFRLSTLEPYMNFYGHKMPVLTLDVSSDGLMLATGSADKSLKLWGMDFGDCRRSIRAHDDAVLSLKFQPNTHYVFTGSRDGRIKYWDCDKFELIATFDGEYQDIWSLAVSDDGELLASSSKDRMMRVWRRTDEQLFLEEEQDKRMDDIFESSLVDEDAKDARKARSEIQGFMNDPAKPDADRPDKRSMDNIKAGERLLEALQLSEEETKRQESTPDDAPNPMLLGLSGPLYVLRILTQIRSPELEGALALLSLSQACSLLEIVSLLLDPSCKSSALDDELLCRITVHLMRSHHSQIVAGALDRSLVFRLSQAVQSELKAVRDRLGFNASALGFWEAELAERNDGAFRDAEARAYNRRKDAERKAKRARR